MQRPTFTAHARGMLGERELDEEWVWLTIESPELQWIGDDGNRHYARGIAQRHGRMLHVVVNQANPPRIVTAFFDRRLGKNHENQD